MICPVTWVPWSLGIVESVPQAEKHSFLTVCHWRVSALQQGKALTHQIKHSVFQGAGKSQVAVLGFPQPQLLNSQLLFTHLISDLGADCCHVKSTSGWQTPDNEGLIFCRSRMDFIYMCHDLYRFCCCCRGVKVS